MARFELKFFDCSDEDYIKVRKYNPDNDFMLDNYPDGIIEINISDNEIIHLDKSTAIKFAKTLRTEINKITESEGGSNG